MNFRFLAVAKDELDDAIAYYEQQRTGLGEEFAQEIKDTIQRIIEHPAAWGTISENTRLCRAKRFPYGIIYYIDGDETLIVAVAHLHRKPGYWKDRLASEP